MSLLIFLGNNPRFDTIEDHVINSNPISQMDRLLNTQHSQNLKLNRGKLVKKTIQFGVLSRRLDSFIYGDDQLIGLLNWELSFSINDRLNTRLNELLLK